MRRLTYYISLSIDGVIAGPDDQVDFYPGSDEYLAWMVDDFGDALPGHVREHLGITAPNRHFDVGIQGRATYKPALQVGITSPYPHLRQYVVSRTMTTSPDPAVEITADPVATVRELKAQEGAGIYLTGGAQLAGALLPEIDELVIKLYPVVAGSGVPLFTADFSPTNFTLTSSRTLDSGTVILTYARA